MQLFKHFARSQSAYAALARPAAAATTFQTRAFTAKVAPGDQTSFGDVSEMFKVNYIVEYEQGLTEDQK